MSEKDHSSEFHESGELKDYIHKLIEEICSQDGSIDPLDLRNKITQELLSRKNENNENKYVQFQPFIPVEPQKCLAHFRAWHYLVGSSADGIEPLYDDLPGEDSVVFLLEKKVEASKQSNQN